MRRLACAALAVAFVVLIFYGERMMAKPDIQNTYSDINKIPKKERVEVEVYGPPVRYCCTQSGPSTNYMQYAHMPVASW